MNTTEAPLPLRNRTDDLYYTFGALEGVIKCHYPDAETVRRIKQLIAEFDERNKDTK